MNNAAGIILALGIACAAILVGLATADHIRNAQIVEFKTPQFAIRSNATKFLIK